MCEEADKKESKYIGSIDLLPLKSKAGRSLPKGGYDMKIPSIHQVVLDGRQSFARFPLVLINAMMGTVVTILLIEHEGPPAASVLFNIVYAALLGIPLLLAIALLIERRQWPVQYAIVAQILGTALLVAYGVTTPSYLNDIPLCQLDRFLLFFAAAHCLVVSLPFSGGTGQNGMWRFAMALLTRFVVSAFYSIVLMIGLSVGLAALDHLFGIAIPGKRYVELNFFIIGIFNTWFFLAGIPRAWRDLEQLVEYPKGLKIFSQYILTSIVTVYLVILYAYVVRIAILWDWPQGWVSRLIVGFSATGVLTLLFLFPLREKEGFRWVRLFWRWFFVVLIPLAFLLPLAVYKRVSIYGITEGRYLGFAFAAWLGAMVLYFLLARSKRIQIIPASLCAAMVFIAVGPWSMFSVSENNQIRRLQEELIRNEILVGDTIRKASNPVPLEDARRISAVISYLHDVHGYERIQPWFRERLQSDTGSGILQLKSPEAVARLLGVDYVVAWATGNETFLSMSADGDAPIDIRGYDQMLGTFFVGQSGGLREFADEGIAFWPLTESHCLEFTVESKNGTKESSRINVEELAARVMAVHGATGVRNLPGDTLSASMRAAGRTFKVFFRNIQLERRQGKLVPVSCSVALALTKR